LLRLLLLHARVPLDAPLSPRPYRVCVGSYTWPDPMPIQAQVPDKQPDTGVDVWLAE
jgi:hypothetical protein